MRSFLQMAGALWLAVPFRTWLLLLTVLFVASGCTMERRGNPTRTPRVQPAGAGAASTVQVGGVSGSVIGATPTPGTVLWEPEPTPAPTPTPTVVTPPAPLAAVVNGEYIFLTDYQSLVAHRKQALVAQGLDPSSEAGQTRLAEMRHEVLEDMIDFALIEQGAVFLGLGLDSDALDEALAADIAGSGGESAFAEWLRATGQNRGQYREMLRQALLSQMVLEAVSAGAVEETDLEANGYSRLAAFEGWLARQREAAVIERFVGD